jgi:uncharacterized membrane protein
VSATFVALGTLHFLRPGWYEAIVPDYLPAQRELVRASGAAAIAGGAGVAFAPARRAAGLWLIATLVAIFPANVHMALHPERYARFPPILLWARLPLQAAIIAWVNAATRPRRA